MEAKKFGQFIAGIRKEKKMTQAELAEKIHVTDKAISRWERGLGFPDIQTLEPLAQVLGISVLELMRSEKKKPTGDMDTTETQYTQKEVAEMLQNADDISKQLKKQDKNANIIAGILVIGVGTLAWATKIASLGGGLVLGGLSAAVFVSLWYFFQNIDDEESRRIYGVASILSIGILVSLVNYIWGDRIAEWIPGGIERTEQIFWTLWYLFMIAMMMVGTIRCVRRQRQKKEKKYKTVLFTGIMAATILKELHCPFIINQNRYSIFDRTIEKNGLKEAAVESGKGIIAFSPLAQGTLTNRYLNGIPSDSRIATDGRFLKASQLTEEKITSIRGLNEIAKERGESLAQMALNWVLKDGIVTSVLVGASKPEQILDNLKVLESAPFTDEELKKIDALSLVHAK